MDAGIFSVVEIGQYFMTKDNGFLVNTELKLESRL